MPSPAHRWLLQITPKARQQLKELPSRQERMAVFTCLRQLLEAENPLSLGDIESIKTLKNVWRRRAGDWRVLFTFTSEPVEAFKHPYKGKLYFLEVRRRNEKTYRL